MERSRHHLLLARHVRLSGVSWKVSVDIMMLLTIWPDSVRDIGYTDRIIRVGPLHLRVEIRLQIGRTIIAFEVALRSTNRTGHVDCLGPADLEAVPFRAFTLVKQVQRRILESHIQIGGVP